MGVFSVRVWGLGVYSLGVLWGCLVCKGVGVGGL